MLNETSLWKDYYVNETINTITMLVLKQLGLARTDIDYRKLINGFLLTGLIYLVYNI